MIDRDAEFMNERRAAIAAANLTFPVAVGEGGAVGGANGGCASLPSSPAVGRRETHRVAGDGEGCTTHPAEPQGARNAMPGGKSVQVRLRLPGDFAAHLLALPPGRRAVALWLALEGRIGDASDLQTVISSAAEMRRIGVLLSQCCRYFAHDLGDSASLHSTVQEAVREIRKLRPPSQSTEEKEAQKCETSDSTGNLAGSKAGWKAMLGGKSVQVRLRLPADFAGLLLALLPRHRRVALWLALDRRIGDAWSLPAVISSATELRDMGVLLNHFCLQFGKGDGDSKLLESAVKEAVQMINKLRLRSTKTERKESGNESDH